MKTCPKCGVENIQTAASCYRCAAPLEGPDDLLGVRADTPFADRLPPTVIISGQEPEHQHGPSSDYGGHIICPNCEVGNEPDWLFCQECGLRLPRPQAAHVDPPRRRADVAPIQEPPATIVAPPVPEQVRPDLNRIALQQRPPELFETRSSDHLDDIDAVPPRRVSREVETNTPPETSFPPADSAPKSERKRMTTTIICSTCGTIQSGEGFFCTSCGSKLSSVAMRRIKERQAEKPAAPNLKLITEGGEVGNSYALDREKTTIGRSRADISFPHDGFMSGLHARIIERDGRYYLVDENSRNGTFIRIQEEIELKPGDMLIVGKQVFKFEKR
ncbi:MAG TPA: zinc ribbon domain-containing protein [Blastocatellia bacterium]|nr:zinc ribbon domain-containing protein [Blastocatellia bacterium]